MDINTPSSSAISKPHQPAQRKRREKLAALIRRSSSKVLTLQPSPTATSSSSLRSNNSILKRQLVNAEPDPPKTRVENKIGGVATYGPSQQQQRGRLEHNNNALNRTESFRRPVRSADTWSSSSSSLPALTFSTPTRVSRRRWKIPLTERNIETLLSEFEGQRSSPPEEDPALSTDEMMKLRDARECRVRSIDGVTRWLDGLVI